MSFAQIVAFRTSGNFLGSLVLGSCGTCQLPKANVCAAPCLEGVFMVRFCAAAVVRVCELLCDDSLARLLLLAAAQHSANRSANIDSPGVLIKF